MNEGYLERESGALECESCALERESGALERESDAPENWQSNVILKRDGSGNIAEVEITDDADGGDDHA